MRASFFRASAWVAAFLAASVFAVEASPSLVASGWVAPSAYVRPSDAAKLAALGLRGGATLDGSAFESLGFRLSLEAYSNLAGIGNSTNWTVSSPNPLSIAVTGNDRLQAALDIKEIWADFSAGNFDFRFGKQILAWGLADGSNPTDNVNARHVGTRFVSTLDEQKMGTLAANVVYNLPENLGTVQGLFMPISVSNDMPPIAMNMLIMGLPSINIVIKDDTPPQVAIENVEAGLRSLFYLGQLSCSASWLSYLDRYPDFRIVKSGSFPSFTTTLTPYHSRVNQFGFDATWFSGGVDLRTEWALTLTADTEGIDPGIKNSAASGVVQASKSFLDGGLNVSLAWAPRFVLNHQAVIAGGRDSVSMLAEYNGQAYAVEHVGTLRLAGKLFGETLQPEALFLAELEARDFLATASLAYNLADGVNIKGGGALYGSFRSVGDPEREWGTFSNSRTIDKDYLYLEMKFSF